MSDENQQPLIRAKNYLDLNNQKCDSERQVALEFTTNSSMKPSERNVLHQDHKDYSSYIEQKSQHESPTFEEHEPGVDLGLEPSNEDTIDILRELLRLERQRNKQRRENYKTLQSYLTLLQTDYLRLAQELVDALEFSKKIKNEKGVQIASLESELREGQKRIIDLEAATSDVIKLRNNFNELLEKQVCSEKERFEKQKQMLEQQLIQERVDNSELLQQFQDRLLEKDNSHKLEINSYRSRLKDIEQERDLILSEPQNELIRLAREERMELMKKLDKFEHASQEASSKYEILKKKTDLLQKELEFIEGKNREELDKIQEAHQVLRVNHQEILLELEDKNEIIQVLQHNLNQSESRSINLLSAIKDKETNWEAIMKQTEIKHEEVLLKAKSLVRSLSKKVTELEVQVEQKQNGLVRCQLEQENQLDSIRSDRDQRLNKLQFEKNTLEQTLQSINMKLSAQEERNERLTGENSKLFQDLSECNREITRISLEYTRKEALAESRLQELNTISDIKGGKNGEFTRHDLPVELEEVQRANERLEKRVKELKKDNQKLLLKLKVNESSLLNISNSIKKEQAKLILDHEKKLELIRQQQVVYESSQSKYRKYGFKLKKYCEHLTQVHKHLCNPLECGYQMVCDQHIKFSIKKT